jgi:hypothetical protein
MKQTYRVLIETTDREEVKRFELLSLKQAEKRQKLEESKLTEGLQVVVEKEENYFED